MNIILYNLNAERILLDKTNAITEVSTLVGTLREECSITEPRMRVQSTGLITANYAYIPEFNRYYFITNIISVRNGMWELSMSIDVLMTYKNEILGLNAYVARNQYKYNAGLVDNDIQLNYVPDINVKTFSDSNRYTVFNKFYGGESIAYVATVGNYKTIATSEVNPSNPAIRNYPYPILNPVYKSSVKSYIFDSVNDLNIFISEALSDTVVAPLVLSIRMYPFSKTNIPSYPEEEVYVGNKKIEGLSNISVVSGLNGNTTIFDWVFSFEDLPPINEANFYDFEPYTTKSIYLPFYGWYDINVRKFYGKSLQVVYVIDYSDGTGTIITYVYENNTQTEMVDIFSVKIGEDIPLTITNAKDVERNATANNIQLGTNITKALFSFGGGVAKGAGIFGGTSRGNAGLIDTSVGLVNDVIDIGANYATNNLMNVEGGKVSNVQSVYGSYYGSMLPTIITVNRTVSVDLDEFAKLHGRLLMSNEVLSELNGYTVLQDFHLENFPTATNTELSLIERQLKIGFILP